MKTRGWLVLVLIALLPVIVWLRSADRTAKTAGVASDAPDVTMDTATIDQFDATGALQYRLVATTIRHFDADDSTQLDAPTLELLDAPQPPWWVRAKTGTIGYRTNADDKREQVVTLRDDVVAEQREDDRYTRFTTSTIDVYPERKYAETDQAVKIDSSSGRTDAIGLTGDLGTDLLKLSPNAKHRVDTTILPNQFKNALARPPSS